MTMMARMMRRVSSPAGTRRRNGPDRAEPSRARKADRDEVFLEYTKSICPVCKVVVDGQVNVRDDKVYLRKRCREHGTFEALLYGDAGMYMDSLRFNKPGTIPLTLQTETVEGCPLDCGLCPEHKQHACLGIIELNSACNLDCPICFADSGIHHPDHYSLTVAQVEEMLDVFVASEGEAEVVMFSGGEPTIHPRLLECIDRARAKPIRHVVLNTNGIRLARDKGFATALAERDVSIYLQFDGFKESTHLQIRGRDLRGLKQRALENCAEAGLTVTLVPAIERGLNDDELGAIVRFGIEHPAVRSVAFQPVTHSGRHVPFDPMNRITNSDVIHGLCRQLPEWLRPSDFFPVPCCFPTCRSITYLLLAGDDVIPVPRLLNMENYMDYVANRVLPEEQAIRAALERLWSSSAVAGTATVAEQLQCASCATGVPSSLADLADTAFMVLVQDFQDPYTLNVKQLMKCCVEEITPDGRLIPFCAYNSVGYREQVRERLTGIAVPDVIPNARTLTPLLADSAHGSKLAVEEPERKREPATASINLGRRLQ